VHLDLREHGPHALVGGTTGAGKSEFLQSWILGMAVDHSPQQVTFLLVDYKGGAAFAEVVRLPHTVGLVTDLTPRLVRRALASLRAEVRHRERLLAAAGAPDLLEMERRGEPGTPPALIIVVDEFAALVQEVPEFVDGVIDVAQRGRSLGLHLILATQRPAGVIRANLRANTNLRVALRRADEDDSIDVLGTGEAALFDPAVPGRAMAKTGPGRLMPFQALYAGGRTSAVAPPPEIAVRTLGFGPATVWECPDQRDSGVPVTDGPTDVHNLVDTVRQAAAEAALPAPRRPWLPEPAAVVELADLAGTSRDDGLVLGVVDDPERQQQLPVAYRPDEDGTLVVLGTGGSGKSTALRALAASAGLAAASARGGPCHLYGLDFGSRGLLALEALPHVGSVVAGDDEERVARLLDLLRDTVDERAERYARLGAATIEEYRTRAGSADEPRIVLLLDNFGGFRAAAAAVGCTTCCPGWRWTAARWACTWR
jgi:DNA segregation ATPase FtsK/SpoIIIE, S-DNA-T family